MEDLLSESEIEQLLGTHQIPARSIELLHNGAKHPSYLVNNRYLIKLSRSQFSDDTIKLKQIDSLPYASTYVTDGSIESKFGAVYYLISEYVPGEDLYSCCLKLTDDQQRVLGEQVAAFLANLHNIKGRYHDIGHYVPAIPHHEGSWRDGHKIYIDTLQNGIDKIDLASQNRMTINAALSFARANLDCLEYEIGPRLLHNDFHPKNIIIHHGVLSGVIDWECSLFGEIDFDLCHIVHWCLFPPDANVSLRPFSISLLKQFLIYSDVSMLTGRLSERQTIYQIEHDIIQLIWNDSKMENERCYRITQWMDGMVDTLLKD